MIGIDLMAASPRPLLGAASRSAAWDEVQAPMQVTLSPHGLASTVFGDVMSGKPSGIARIAISGGNYWKPDPGFEANANAWDNSQGGAPSATVYFLNGSRQQFPGLQSIDVRGGSLRRGVQARRKSWFTRVFSIGADAPTAGQSYTDAATVLAVQQQLLARGITDASGNPIKPDGIMGRHTAAAIRKLQAALGAGQSGQIDEGVLMALGVPAPAGGAAPEPPADGRPGKGWSQPMPEAIGPAIVPATPGGAAGTLTAVSAAPVSKGVFVAIAGAVIVVVGGLLLIFTGGKKRR